MSHKIAVIGAGSWGNTLANLLAKKDYSVNLWVFEADQLAEMQETRMNKRYLPGVPLPEQLELTDNLPNAVKQAEILVLAVPSHAMRGVCGNIKPYINEKQIFVNVAKGIENDSLKRTSEVIGEVLAVPESRIATLYGPSHAEEVATEIATAVVSASPDLKTARRVRNLFSTNYFRVYSSDDIVGVEVGGSVKNVIAIAAGVCDGAGFGDNTKAALLTRGMVEIQRLGVALGAKPETFAGLSGIGDLIVTCMSKHSRNRHVGEQIGRGRTLKEVLEEMVMVAEGVKTTRSVHQVAQKLGLEMPISEQVYAVLFHDKNPHEAVEELMTREAKDED